MSCPSQLELTRALTVGAEPGLAAHLDDCASCRDTWNATRAAIELARELPVTLPSPARREEMRTAVLAAGARTAGRRGRRIWLAPLMVSAAAAGVAGMFAIARESRSSSAAAATDVPAASAVPATLAIGPSPRATLATTVEPPAPAAAPPLAPTAPAGSPARPARSARAHPQRSAVDPGALAPPRSVEPPPSAEPPPAVVASLEPPARAAHELAYDQAWEALRAGDFARAARGFSQVLTLAPDSALVEDASFWRAVALARGKRIADALSAFREFLDGYARSARAGEASAALGWLLVDARDYDEAARRFTAAAGDANPAVRRSAQAGLDALAKRSR